LLRRTTSSRVRNVRLLWGSWIISNRSLDIGQYPDAESCIPGRCLDFLPLHELQDTRGQSSTSSVLESCIFRAHHECVGWGWSSFWYTNAIERKGHSMCFIPSCASCKRVMMYPTGVFPRRTDDPREVDPLIDLHHAVSSQIVAWTRASAGQRAIQLFHLYIGPGRSFQGGTLNFLRHYQRPFRRAM